ncbi:hypothetical protein [Corynebacterium pygosceleis]|uniref:Uncharacterized protein n=1 Tax=Corynebacterium pygosceleis TaxID=2800406 RepID=A0A9Q4C890_9CORY|nr:hypothetical protein [Corynebacterium pygosceleis]MCK7637407.1 hypothetical protein [Corynebacterium pygosceleis]MCK7676057.1 hypothetical protein [Corynebacterium pygosceleis]MCL0119817.1 hypothetical protein [Corynebacterium pygosceleis]MCX7468264.1 hypothetical protein [Corynebacterium pygosceleis]
MRQKILWILISVMTFLVVLGLIPRAIELWDTEPPWRAAADTAGTTAGTGRP